MPISGRAGRLTSRPAEEFGGQVALAPGTEEVGEKALSSSDPHRRQSEQGE